MAKKYLKKIYNSFQIFAAWTSRFLRREELAGLNNLSGFGILVIGVMTSIYTIRVTDNPSEEQITGSVNTTIQHNLDISLHKLAKNKLILTGTIKSTISEEEFLTLFPTLNINRKKFEYIKVKNITSPSLISDEALAGALRILKNHSYGSVVKLNTDTITFTGFLPSEYTNMNSTALNIKKQKIADEFSQLGFSDVGNVSIVKSPYLADQNSLVSEKTYETETDHQHHKNTKYNQVPVPLDE